MTTLDPRSDALSAVPTPVRSLSWQQTWSGSTHSTPHVNTPISSQHTSRNHMTSSTHSITHHFTTDPFITSAHHTTSMHDTSSSITPCHHTSTHAITHHMTLRQTQCSLGQCSRADRPHPSRISSSRGGYSNVRSTARQQYGPRPVQ